MDVARLNFSHGSAEEHAETAQRVRDAANRAGRNVAILQDLPGPKLRIGKLRDGLAELKPGDEVTFVCGEHDDEGDSRRMYITWAGLADTVEPDEVMYLADGAVRLRINAHARRRRRDRRGRRGRRLGRLAPGAQHPRRDRGAAVGPRGGLRATSSTGEKIGVDLVALSFVRRAEDIEAVRKHTRAAADRQDREAAGRAARGGDRARRRLRDGRARRPRHRDADRGGADRPEADHLAGRRARPPGDHRDADARLDGRLLAPDARRGDRRRQRDPRRHRRGDALPGERRRPLPGRRRRDAGRDRRAHRADRAVPRVERAPRAARPPRSRPTRSPTRRAAPRTSSASPRSSARRCRAAPRG